MRVQQEVLETFRKSKVAVCSLLTPPRKFTLPNFSEDHTEGDVCSGQDPNSAVPVLLTISIMKSGVP